MKIEITGDTPEQLLSNFRSMAAIMGGEFVEADVSSGDAPAVAATRTRKPKETAAAPSAATSTQTSAAAQTAAVASGTVTREQVRIKSQELNAGGHREKLMAVIKSYGVAKLSEVPDALLTDIMAKFNAIG